MIHQKILQIITNNLQVKKFMDDLETFEVLTTKLESEEIKRLSLEYPKLLPKKGEKITISCITIVKNNLDVNNYEKLRKIKLYIDETNENIIKILQN